MENNEILKAILDQFDKVDKKFDALDKKMDQLDKRFEQSFNEVDTRFNEVDTRFNVVDKKFNVVDKKLEEVILRLDNIEKNQQEDFKATLNLIIKKVDNLTYDIDYLSEKTGKHDTKINSLEKRIQS
jgi:septation ring formation regulator EzrA